MSEITLTQAQKDELKAEYLIPIGNMIRRLERKAVNHASHRSIEVLAQCLHTKLDELRVTFGVDYQENELNPSVYGENGDK